MKKFGKLKLLGLVVISMMVLIFMAISFLEAKKSQKWTWSLKIPGESYNLFGYEKVYQNTDNVRVGAKKYKGGPTTGYYLSLDINNSQSDQACDEGLTEEKIGFQNLDFTDWDFDEDGIYCIFPPNNIPTNFDQGCPLNPPDCMECFLEQYAHPNCGYYSFTLLIRVDYDIEKINTDNPVSCSGKVYIDVRNTFDVLEYDNSDYHNILSANDVTMEISRDDPYTWTVTINDYLDFKENYKVKKGKKNWEYKNPLRAKTWFSFETTWMRDQK